MTIELGELPTAGAEPVDDGPAARLDRRTIRKVGLVLTAIACTLGVTGSTRPEPHGVRAMWDVANVDGYGSTLTPDTLFVSQPTGTDVRLTAYELASGEQRWSTLVDVDPALVDAPAVGLVLMAGDRKQVTIEEDDGVYTTEFATTTTALDAATGARRWTLPGDVQQVWQDTALMVDYTDQGKLRRLRLIRLTDRGTIWTRDAPEIQSQGVGLIGDRPDRIVTVSAGGEVVVTNFADGAPIAAGRVPWDPPRPNEGIWNEIIPIGDYLVISRTHGDRAGVTVYRMSSMAAIWSQQTDGGYPFGCGSAICINDGSRLAAYDPETGQRRWQVLGAFNSWQPGPGRLVLEDGGGQGEQRLIDAETGVQLGETVEGNTIWAWQLGRAERLLVLQPTKSPPMRTSVSRWDLSTGRTHLLGTIDYQVEHRCQTIDHYLACTNAGQIQVTAVG